MLVAISLGVIGAVLTLAGCFIWLIHDNRRHAQRVRDLRAQTPDHDQHGGPTRYDNHGRVTF